MEARSVAVVCYDGAELLDIACVTTTFALANLVGELAVPYEVTLLAPGGHPITCGPGIVLHSGQALEHFAGPVDTLVVSGGLSHERAADNSLIVAHVRRLARVSRRVTSVCTGASVLAAAGLLDGMRATTHWAFAAQIAERYPNVTIDPDPIYIRDGHMATSAGITSALDLMLSLVQEDHGLPLARRLSRHLVTYLQRPGNQAQMSLFTAAPPPDHDVVRRLVDHIHTHPDGDLTTAALAALAGVSARHLTRLFLDHLGQTPGRFVRQSRLTAAAHLLTTTSLPLPGVAARCGFGSSETLRQAFQRRYGIPPSRYRAASHAETDTHLPS
ncbi:GlxA family transcriptional regulator [Streptomyces galbus]|uniref:Helix-turn-helix domain-containing protein n=1 Tax=Streptomyces galbus TaxID=33898 RepID=A0A4U5X070_STRGB|nr:helix-turn-helix domain-containing protein [Streptomyces galbus]TKT06646.1 helix-turn-helix domain-containing protein [Streptomyces galbus]